MNLTEQIKEALKEVDCSSSLLDSRKESYEISGYSLSLVRNVIQELDKNPPIGILGKIIQDIIDHDKENPEHGRGCACMDKHSTHLRRYIYDRLKSHGQDSKSFENLMIVFSRAMR